jgi:hypothetical protein
MNKLNRISSNAYIVWYTLICPVKVIRLFCSNKRPFSSIEHGTNIGVAPELKRIKLDIGNTRTDEHLENLK